MMVQNLPLLRQACCFLAATMVGFLIGCHRHTEPAPAKPSVDWVQDSLVSYGAGSIGQCYQGPDSLLYYCAASTLYTRPLPSPGQISSWVANESPRGWGYPLSNGIRVQYLTEYISDFTHKPSLMLEFDNYTPNPGHFDVQLPLDSIKGLPLGCKLRYGSLLPTAALAPLYEDGNTYQWDFSFAAALYDSLGDYLYMSHVGPSNAYLQNLKDDHGTVIKLYARTHPLSYVPQPQIDAVFYSYPCFYASCNGRLYRIQKDGIYSEVIRASSFDIPFTKVQGFGDTVLAYASGNTIDPSVGLYMSVDAGRTFPTKYPSNFAGGVDFYRVGNKMIASFENTLYTFHFSATISLIPIATKGLPKAKIIGVYKVGDLVYCVTEYGAYTKAYKEFMASLTESASH